MKFFDDNADGIKGLIRGATAFFASHAKKEKAVADRLEAENKAAAAAEAEAAARAAQLADNPPEEEPFRDRAKVISESDLGPAHIIGSWFLARLDERVMMGLIVGQVEAPGQSDARYLLQLFDGLLDKKTNQIIVPQSRMLFGHVSEAQDRMGMTSSVESWEFYDTQEELKSAWQDQCLLELAEERSTA